MGTDRARLIPLTFGSSRSSALSSSVSSVHLDAHDPISMSTTLEDEKISLESDNSTIVADLDAEAKLARKTDWHIVPTVFLLYLWCFIDRANIGNARLAGFEKDLGLKGYDFNLILTSFYVPYVVFELPSTLACKYFGPGRWLPFVSFMFGLCSLCTAFVHTRAQASGVRFLLGVFEAGMLPGISYYLSRWYRKSELAFRLSLYLVASPLAGAFGGLLASGILKLDGVGSIRTWRMIFLIEGIATCAVSIFGYFTLTDRPDTARWLSKEEKLLSISRVQSENIGSTELLDKFDKTKFKRGVLNPNTLVVAFIFLFDCITVQGLAFFLPTIVRTIYPEKSTISQQLYTVPPYIVAAVYNVVLPYISWKVGRRLWIFPPSALLAVISYVILLSTGNPHARYGAIFLGLTGVFIFAAVANAHVSANCLSDTARASAVGITVLFGNVGGLISTWTYVSSDAPLYHIGNGLNLATATSMFILSIGLYIWCKRDNRRRDAIDSQAVLAGLSEKETQDLEWKHPDFRWKL